MPSRAQKSRLLRRPKLLKVLVGARFTRRWYGGGFEPAIGWQVRQRCTSTPEAHKPPWRVAFYLPMESTRLGHLIVKLNQFLMELFE